ncbi:MAG: VWA domain-containing protein [Planctomycetales bacterium]|nr:VWA domain-containing protein [Planctomycetales bacterium]
MSQIRSRRGATLAWTALTLVLLCAMAAFSLDIGIMMLAKTELQLAADSGALAAGNAMDNTAADIQLIASEFATSHSVVGKQVTGSEVNVELGNWNSEQRDFAAGNQIGNAVRVTVTRTNLPLFFGHMLGRAYATIQASAVATANPRDIAFVVDLSGSMNDDTEPVWATQTIDSAYASAGYPTAGTDLIQALYQDFGYGTYPGQLEYVGQPLGVVADEYAYAEMTKDDGPLSGFTVPDAYRIVSTDTEATRKVKGYSWIIDNQIARLMPNALPAPTTANYAYWEKYLDYILISVKIAPPEEPSSGDSGGGSSGGDSTPTGPSPPPIGQLPRPHRWSGATEQALAVWSMFAAPRLASSSALLWQTPGAPPTDRGWIPYWQDSDRIYKFNNPNNYTFPSASWSLPHQYRNWIGYATYVQFMLDHGRDLRPDNSNLTPLSIFNSSCPYHSESVNGQSFLFPPREQPAHASRRAIISAIQVAATRNSGIPAGGARDRVAIVTYDSVDNGAQLIQTLTDTYSTAMQMSTYLQSTGDKGRTTATEAGLSLASQHLKPASEGGAGRERTQKVVILLTDGVPNDYISSNTAIDSYFSSNPDSNMYGGGYYWYDAALMQGAKLQSNKVDVYPVGIGLGADYDFMDRLARIGGTADVNGQATRGSGNPAEYEQRLIDIFERIIKRPTARLVK